jgi:hypothetical protein
MPTISNESVKDLKRIAEVSLKGEMGYHKLDWRDAQGFIRIVRDIIEGEGL